MGIRMKLYLLFAFVILLVTIFMVIDVGGSWSYIIPRRATKIVAMVLIGACIAISTLIFQTVTNNRILTPSIIGFDSLYILIQTAIIFLFGTVSAIVLNFQLNYFLSVGLMIVFALLIYYRLLQKEGKNIYLLLLVGIILGTLFQSVATFMQVLIDPNEFMSIQSRMFASFNQIKTELLVVSIVIFSVVYIYLTRYIKFLDVLALGRDEAINLGVDYTVVVKRLLIVIAILVSISTALVGPITFLGLLVVNVAYEFLKTYEHKYLLIGTVLISIITLIGGQLIVERVFTFSTPLSVIINFVGGIYFIYLLLRGAKKEA